MSRLFRQPSRGVSGYAALILFAVAYVAAISLVVTPDTLLGDQPVVAQDRAADP